jgi:cytochrome c-type biogenesis protein CcmH
MRYILPLLLLLTMPAYAVEPDEILQDPVLEKRARNISQHLRCLVCQSEAIDESNADFARDLRLLVRKRLLAGDTDAQVMQYLKDRYGDFILLAPPVEGKTLFLWLTPAVVLGGGFFLAARCIKKRET